MVGVKRLMLMVIVHASNLQDRYGAKFVLKKITGKFLRLEIIWAADGYSGKLVDWIKITYSWVLEVVKHSDDVKGFKVLFHRWVVERTFGWLGLYRR